MKAGELCVRDVVTAFADDAVTDAARRMVHYDVGDLVVVVAQPSALPRPVGIITDRDLVVHVLARPDREPGAIRVADVMTGEIVVAREDEDVESVLGRMRAHGIRRVPIVDDEGGLQGVISLDDVLAWMRDQLDATARTIEHQGLGPREHPGQR